MFDSKELKNAKRICAKAFEISQETQYTNKLMVGRRRVHHPSLFGNARCD